MLATLHIVDVRLTCLINITYLLTYLLKSRHIKGLVCLCLTQSHSAYSQSVSVAPHGDRWQTLTPTLTLTPTF